MGRKRSEWQAESACKGDNPENYFAPKGSRRCDICTVASDCLAYSIVHEYYGTWGGQSTKLRCGLRKQLLEQYAYDAFVEGWLEPHHLVPVKMLEDIEMIARLQTEQPRVITMDVLGAALDFFSDTTELVLSGDFFN